MIPNPFSGYGMNNFSRRFQQNLYFSKMEGMALKNLRDSQKMRTVIWRDHYIKKLQEQWKYSEAQRLEIMYQSLDKQEQRQELLTKISEFICELGLEYFGL